MTAQPRPTPHGTPNSSVLTPLPSRPPPAFDPAAPAAERWLALAAALPAPLRDILAAGRVERRPRFGDGGFDGVTEDWTPPDGVTGQHALMARRALGELTGSVLAPASPEHLLARVLALLSHYPAKGTAPEVEHLVALDWAEDLGEFPAWAVDAAARSWRRTRKWRPSIAEMRALCEEVCAPERALARRLSVIAASGDGAGDAADRCRTGQLRALAGGAVRRMR
ncbi:hypothetical protein [Azospirillum isscasi]|uniref:Uncharacterized protein n=1 Tax=Azospirillum isscasi TaxID=3053926 RepID=A0ABU0WLM0_9PROT|nr:hypothetical protein [Azospirillum isscasi]MDQ2105134.1 hypothetical protein [Azospirillum isscasi]